MGFLEVAALTLSLEGWVEASQETWSVISGNWCELQSSSQAPLPSAPLDSAPHPHRREKAYQVWGPCGVVPDSAGSVDLKTGASDAALTGAWSQHTRSHP